jgi:hypothetical protein
MSVTNEEIYDKLLDIEKRIFNLEQKINGIKKPDVFEYEQKIKPVQYEQPKIRPQKFTPPIKQDEIKQEENLVKKKKSLLDENDDEDDGKTFSLKDALGFV